MALSLVGLVASFALRAPSTVPHAVPTRASGVRCVLQELAEPEQLTGASPMLAWKRTRGGLKYVDDFVGGSVPAQGQVVAVHYTISLADTGVELGSTHNRAPMTIAVGRHQVPIWSDALENMNVGGKRRVIVPYAGVPNQQISNVPKDEEGEDLRLEIEVVRVETGVAAVIPSLLPPHTRRATIMRTLFALSFVPYFLPEELKPEAYKFGDVAEIHAAREAAQNTLFLGGDGALPLDSLFQ